MGSTAHDLMEGYRILRLEAARVLCDARVLYRCEFHGTLLDNMGNVESAYRLAMARISRGEIHLTGGTKRDFTDAIKHVYEQTVGKDDCGECAYAMR